MAYATEPKVGRGTRIEFQDPNADPVDTWTLLTWLETPPEVGTQGSTIEVAPLHVEVPFKYPSDEQTSDIEYVVFDVPSDAAQQAFEALKNSTVTMRHVMSNGRTLTYDFAFTGIKYNAPTRTEPMKMTYSGSQSGAEIATETV
ncbi:MAG: hypothetical protein CME36_09710 [unclassified Hahellaceae]|nr:hypothetical protein [Hahellaceae bacterium]|tara:strand:- start:36292 stop:36723 length:432 start_codon:yes stop_codon:yes gene_type:complete